MRSIGAECKLEMTEQHKEALKLGRLEARAIKAYLKALDALKPGRPVTRESLESRLGSVEAKIAESDLRPSPSLAGPATPLLLSILHLLWH